MKKSTIESDSKTTSTNTTAKSKYLPIRWPFELLDESKNMARELDETWAEFVRTATQERIDRVKKQK